MYDQNLYHLYRNIRSAKMSELSSLHKNANMSKDTSEQVMGHDFISQNVKCIHESPHKKKC